MKLGAAGAAEVAELGVIHAELVVDVVDEFGDEKIQIRVALAVPCVGMLSGMPSSRV